jgi:hypothetical protein
VYSDKINQRLEKSCEFINELIDKNGNVPNIGDQDSAVLVNFSLDNKGNYRSVLNTGSFLFNRKDFKVSDEPDIKTLVLYPEADEFFESKKQPGSFNKKVSLFKDSGISVIKNQFYGKDYIFAGNATKAGMAPLYAHGHLDPLSFYLSFDGKEIFVDPGTYLYGNSGKWRNYFRSTKAHNTIEIDNNDLCLLSGDFMMSNVYKITNHDLIETSEAVIWKAGHDAYKNIGVNISREVVFPVQENCFYITDCIETKKLNLINWYFHFAPECSVSLKENTAFIEIEDIFIKMSFQKDLEAELFKGSKEPLLGWFSKDFNHIEESFCLNFNKKSSSDKEIILFKIEILKEDASFGQD